MSIIQRIIILFFLTGLTISSFADDDMYAIYDGHIHYDKDVWTALPPSEAIQLLLSANITRALVSATPTEGADMLYRENPDVVIPMLRPYKDWRHRYTWFKDPELSSYLQKHLHNTPYRGIGEFHIFGNDAYSKPFDDMIKMIRKLNLVLHIHTDIPGMKIILAKAQAIDTIWAHGGFDAPIAILEELLINYPNLYIELSLREGMLHDDGQLTMQWKSFLEKYSSRFIVGADTYKPSRWAELRDITNETRRWLNQLSTDAADNISRNNLDRIFPVIKTMQ